MANENLTIRSFFEKVRLTANYAIIRLEKLTYLIMYTVKAVMRRLLCPQ